MFAYNGVFGQSENKSILKINEQNMNVINGWKEIYPLPPAAIRIKDILYLGCVLF